MVQSKRYNVQYVPNTYRILRTLQPCLYQSGVDGSDMAVIIEGDSLSVALEENNRMNFLELCQECRTVVCCRVSPLQKALVAQLVKENNLAVTLAIGDGANDVAMIKAAHIGIGISGREGMAAVLASDYAIGQFRFLARLLLIHGRWSYKRNKLLVMYAFYKNIVCVMGHCYLAFYSGLSAQSLYPTALISTYNLFWTSLPTMVLSTFDQDVQQLTAASNPQLYAETQGEKIQSFFGEAGYWFLSGFWHSIVVFFFPLATIETAGGNGMLNGIFNLGVAAYTLCVVLVNLKIIFSTNSFTVLSIFVVWIVSILSYFIFLPVISLMGQTIGSFNDLSDVGFKLYASASFWLLLLLGVVTAFLPDWTLAKLLRQRTPNDYQICQEIEHGWRDGLYSKNPGFVGPLARRPPQASEDRNTPDSALLDLVSFPTRKVRPSQSESEDLPSRRRMTWREVLSEVELEAISRAEMEQGWARRVSNGFEVVTRHSDVTTVPRPLEEGPLPLLRLRTV
ncbi:hypothetical protein L7F22_006716 [Adiantum nelumboides]|nr:hypothetical protein [Adiantum nelumboides]